MPHVSASPVSAEIASQPACWMRGAELAATATGLPVPGERVAVTGCGTSLYIAQAFAVAREAARQGETDAWPASEFPTGRRYDPRCGAVPVRHHDRGAVAAGRAPADVQPAMTAARAALVLR